MQYVTPSMQDMASLLYGGGGNCCTAVGDGDYNVCSAGTGTAGCWWLGGPGHGCTSGAGDDIDPNNCPAGGTGP